MTTPHDETSQHPPTPASPDPAPADPAAPDPASRDASPASRDASPADPTAADPTALPGAAPRPPMMPGGPLGEPAPPPPPLIPDPNRPADPGWREPPWIPPHRRESRPNLAALVVGLAFIAFGAWFFLDRTLGVALPTIRWGSVWPIALIVVGGIVLLRSLDRTR